MEVQVHEVGRSKSKVIVIDDCLPNAIDLVDAAAALPTFPLEVRTGYPGRRHQIGPGDKASVYVMDILRVAGLVIPGYFHVDNFRVFEASYSLATTPPAQLKPGQRIPHYDWDDPAYLAILLHLHHIPQTGTAFYRHRASGLEQIDKASVPQLRNWVQADLADEAREANLFQGQMSTHYEQIFHVEGRFNRLVIYPGCLLHSGYFSPEFNYSDDPRAGRLTANLFIQTGKGGG